MSQVDWSSPELWAFSDPPSVPEYSAPAIKHEFQEALIEQTQKKDIPAELAGTVNASVHIASLLLRDPKISSPSIEEFQGNSKQFFCNGIRPGQIWKTSDSKNRIGVLGTYKGSFLLARILVGNNETQNIFACNDVWTKEAIKILSKGQNSDLISYLAPQFTDKTGFPLPTYHHTAILAALNICPSRWRLSSIDTEVYISICPNGHYIVSDRQIPIQQDCGEACLSWPTTQIGKQFLSKLSLMLLSSNNSSPIITTTLENNFYRRPYVSPAFRYFKDAWKGKSGTFYSIQSERTHLIAKAHRRKCGFTHLEAISGDKTILYKDSLFSRCPVCKDPFPVVNAPAGDIQKRFSRYRSNKQQFNPQDILLTTKNELVAVVKKTKKNAYVVADRHGNKKIFHARQLTPIKDPEQQRTKFFSEEGLAQYKRPGLNNWHTAIVEGTRLIMTHGDLAGEEVSCKTSAINILGKVMAVVGNPPEPVSISKDLSLIDPIPVTEGQHIVIHETEYKLGEIKLQEILMTPVKQEKSSISIPKIGLDILIRLNIAKLCPYDIVAPEVITCAPLNNLSRP